MRTIDRTKYGRRECLSDVVCVRSRHVTILLVRHGAQITAYGSMLQITGLLTHNVVYTGIVVARPIPAYYYKNYYKNACS